MGEGQGEGEGVSVCVHACVFWKNGSDFMSLNVCVFAHMYVMCVCICAAVSVERIQYICVCVCVYGGTTKVSVCVFAVSVERRE